MITVKKVVIFSYKYTKKYNSPSWSPRKTSIFYRSRPTLIL